jgi:hypothetical protein
MVGVSLVAGSAAIQNAGQAAPASGASLERRQGPEPLDLHLEHEHEHERGSAAIGLTRAM